MIHATTSHHFRFAVRLAGLAPYAWEETGGRLGGQGWMDQDGLRRLYGLVQKAKVGLWIARNMASFGHGRPLLIRAETGVLACTSPCTSPCMSPCRESMYIYIRKKVRKCEG